MGVEALDAQPRAAFEVTQQRAGFVGQPAETAEAGVQHQMYGNGLAGAFGGAFEQCAALRAVYRGGQVQPQDGIGFGGRDGGRQHQNRRADARPAQRFRLVEVQNRQRGRTLVQQNPADRKQPGAVGVAFHHADNRTPCSSRRKMAAFQRICRASITYLVIVSLRPVLPICRISIRAHGQRVIIRL